MKRALWLFLTLVLIACGGSPETPTVDVTSRDATSIARQVATIDARNAIAALPEPSATSMATPLPIATPSPTATPAEPLARLLPDNDHANVRSGPGTDYPILGTLQPSVTARITGKDDAGAWWQIDYNNAPGWVIGQLVDTLGDTTMVQPRQVAPAPTATPSPQPYLLAKAGFDYVNVRTAPAHTSDVIGQLQPNTPARIIGKIADESWWQIDFGGASRWIDGNFVDLRGDTSTAAVVSVATQPASARAAQAQDAQAAPAQAQIAAAQATATTAPQQTTSGCGASTGASYELLPRDGPASNRPDRLHGDLNLALRGYAPTDAPATLIGYNGSADPNAPQFTGMFQPNRTAPIQSAYRVNLWRFESSQCNGAAYGCAGSAVTNWPVTMIGLATTPGERISIPSRAPEIGSGYQALVLYADTTRITLNYTRQDNISFGYVVYIENVCVDSTLLALYRAQNNADGWRSSASLPALRNGQPLGVAAGNEIRVAIRDSATFMDPRSRKDWWH